MKDLEVPVFKMQFERKEDSYPKTLFPPRKLEKIKQPIDIGLKVLAYTRNPLEDLNNSKVYSKVILRQGEGTLPYDGPLIPLRTSRQTCMQICLLQSKN
jgi:hypothetical protein